MKLRDGMYAAASVAYDREGGRHSVALLAALQAALDLVPESEIVRPSVMWNGEDPDTCPSTLSTGRCQADMWLNTAHGAAAQCQLEPGHVGNHAFNTEAEELIRW